MSVGAIAISVALIGAFALACGAEDPEPLSELSGPSTQMPSSDRRVPAPTQAVSASPTASSDVSPTPSATSPQAPQVVVTAESTETAVPATATAVPPALESVGSVASDAEDGVVSPDPDFERAMFDANISERGWNTDFSRHTVPYSEIRAVIPRDNIPSIDAPQFVSTTDASAWLKDVEPVVSVEIEGEARAYPLQILTWHEIVNDDVGGIPVAVTFCPLCNSAIAFDRRFDDKVLEFGVSGNLRNSDLIMYDRQTHSWWQQFTGEGIVGEYAGHNLELLPAFIVSFADFRTAHPDGKILSRDTGYARQYGRNPYAGYDTADGNPFLFRGDLDGRLLPVERVIAVTIGKVDLAFPLTVLQEKGVINYSVGDRSIAVFHKLGTASALDASSIAESRDVGSAGVFDAELGGDILTFAVEDGMIVDEQTGSVWNILGRAVEGPLSGETLTPVIHGNHFWFAWAVFKPDTIVYQGVEGG